MRILVFESDNEKAKKIVDYTLNHFGLLQDCKPEYVVANKYDWQYLAESFGTISWRRGEFDAVIVTSCNLQSVSYNDIGQYGLVVAAEAKKLNIPCMIVLPHETWMFDLACKLSARSFQTLEGFSCGFDIRELMLGLCDEFEKKGIDYH